MRSRRILHVDGNAFFAECAEKSDCPVFILHGANDQSVPVSHADPLEAAARKPKRLVKKLIIPDADHTFNRLDWQQQAIEATAKWFAQTL